MKNHLFKLTFFILIFLTFTLLFLRPVRKIIYSFFHKPHRDILSVVQGPLMGIGSKVQVVKIKTHKGLFLEFYDISKKTVQPVLDKIPLLHSYDGYLNFKNQPTNLFLLDIDKDGRIEVIAPSFDKKLVSYLNIFHYDFQKKKFVRANLDLF